MPPKNQRWWLTEDNVSLEIDADADADADTLYAMVSDLPRTGGWSPECEGVDWEGDVANLGDARTRVTEVINWPT